MRHWVAVSGAPDVDTIGLDGIALTVITRSADFFSRRASPYSDSMRADTVHRHALGRRAVRRCFNCSTTRTNEKRHNVLSTTLASRTTDRNEPARIPSLELTGNSNANRRLVSERADPLQATCLDSPCHDPRSMISLSADRGGASGG
jgi:hypothetical protein